MTKLTTAIALFAAAGALLSTPSVGAGNDKKITVGQSAALRGPASALGEGMQAGINAYFKAINAKGGVNGTQLDLKSVNDGYEPEKCAAATKVLVEADKVFALMGYVGTPTARAALPIAEAAKVPMIGPFTGAEVLRNPHNPLIVNVRASYFQEMETVAEHLVGAKGFKKIACFYQNDAFGQTGLDGIERALKKRGIELVAKGSFERNTVAIADGLKTIADSKPDAIVTIAPYKPTGAFVKGVRENADIKNATITAISFVGTTALVGELAGAGDGVIISQVVPYPWDNSVPVVKEFTDAMKAAGQEKQIDFISLEGFITAKLFAEVLAKAGPDATADKWLNTLTSTGAWDVGGFPMTFGPSDNQGSDAVFLTVIQGGKAVPMTAAVSGVDTK
jgi:branched-chain amino acid transport system substrate-binding protein